MDVIGQAILDAIIANPADDAPRIAFADWLDQNGDEWRAMFIRTDIRMLRDPPKENCQNKMMPRHETPMGNYTQHCQCESCKLIRLLWTIWRHHGSRWEGEFYGPIARKRLEKFETDGIPLNANPMRQPIVPTWKRGFIAGIKCDMADWLFHGPAIVMSQPIERVDVSDARIEPSNRGLGGWNIYVPVDWGNPNRVAWIDTRKLYGHPTQSAASDALSSACIAWAKSGQS